MSEWKRRKAAERGPSNPYGVKHSYFSPVRTPIQAYILGLLAADGYILTHLNRIGLELATRDRALVELVRDELAPEAPTHDRPPRAGHHGGGVVTLTLHSAEMVSSLARYGVTDRKSLALAWPTELPRLLERPFILGCFDGDGCIASGRKLGCRWEVVSGSLSFLEEMRGRVEPVAGVSPYLTKRKTLYALTVQNPAAVSALDAWLHAGGLGLDRKRLPQEVSHAAQSAPLRTQADE